MWSDRLICWCREQQQETIAIHRYRNNTSLIYFKFVFICHKVIKKKLYFIGFITQSQEDTNYFSKFWLLISSFYYYTSFGKKNHWRGLISRNARMGHIVDFMRAKNCVSMLVESLFVIRVKNKTFTQFHRSESSAFSWNIILDNVTEFSMVYKSILLLT